MNSYTEIVEQKVQEKLREYQTNPAKFYLDIFPNCTEQQTQFLNQFLNNQFNKFEVKRNDPYTYDTFAKLAVYSFLINPTTLTLVVLPPRERGLEEVIKRALSKVFQSFKNNPFVGQWVIPQLSIRHSCIGRIGHPNAGILIKYLSPCNLMGYPPETNLLVFGDIGFTPATWETLVNISYDNKIALFREV